MTYENSRCFDKVTFNFESSNDDDAKSKIVIETEGYTGKCTDFFIFANTEMLEYKMINAEGSNEVEVEMKGDDAQANLDFSGVKLFESCY